jgi:hypothetical protein
MKSKMNPIFGFIPHLAARNSCFFKSHTQADMFFFCQIARAGSDRFIHRGLCKPPWKLD